ncbi:penicillin-binding protein [Patescibacteria group bacterium]
MSWKRTWKRRVKKLKAKGKRISKLDKARLYRTLALFALGGVVAFGLLLAILFAWFARDLPSPDKIIRREGFATKIMDREEELLYEVFAEQQRTPVEVDEIPEKLKQATVAIEDKDFYTHEGFDVFGMLRGFSRLFTRGRAQGGSTLTQQLVKNVLLSSERKLSRKFKEFILSVQIERRYSKDQILQMYLNEAPYGGTAWGVSTAADLYFGKSVNELSLLESAVLAGMPQRPSAYSPYGSTPDAYVSRTKNVLRRMKEDGYISKDEEKQALEELSTIEFKDQEVGIKAPHFVLYVKQILEDMYGEKLVEQGGLKVITTLDFELHEKAQEIISEEIADVEDLHITNGAATVLDPNTGEILSMVGSKDYFADDYDGQVNVNLSLRQPGSSIKPITYATAFKKGYTPAHMLMDTLTEFPGGDGKVYKPQNYTGEYHGPTQLRFALGNSLNVPAVKLLALVGVKDMLQIAYDMGFTTLEPSTENMRRFGLSVTLGGGEVRLIDMVSAYSAFANGGLRVEPISILKVEDKDGKVLFEHKKVKNRRVLNEGVAFLMNHILSDDLARHLTFGANSYLSLGDNVAVKTGTTNDKRDNWTVGWSNSVMVGVWVGNNDNSAMTRVASGVTGASPIWRRIIVEALRTRPAEAWDIPKNVEAVLVDSVSGYPEHHAFPARSEYIMKGTLPPLPDPIHAMVKVCKSSGKLATNIDIAKGEYDEKEYVVLQEDDPLHSDRNAWQEAINEWLVSYPDPKYHPPTEKCDSANEVVVKVNNPKGDTNFEGNDVPIEIDVVTSGSVDKVDVLVDGSIHTSFTGDRIRETLTLSDGNYVLKVRARRSDGKTGESGDIRIGVGGIPWEGEPEPTPDPTPTPTPDPTPTPTPDPTPTPTP